MTDKKVGRPTILRASPQGMPSALSCEKVAHARRAKSGAEAGAGKSLTSGIYRKIVALFFIFFKKRELCV